MTPEAIQQIGQMLYSSGSAQCRLCYGRGFYTLIDDDSCDVVACECVVTA